MSTQLALTTDRGPDGALVVAAVGEIDMSNVDALAAALSQAESDPLVLDLTAVEYLDSAGLAAIFSHVDRIRLVATPLLAPVLTVAGLDDLTTVRED